MPKRKRLYGCALKKKKVTPIAKKGRKKKTTTLIKKEVKRTLSTSNMNTLLKQFKNFPLLGKSKWKLNDAIKHLASVEPKFETLFEAHGVPQGIQDRLTSNTLDNSDQAFHSLCRTIIYQQLAGKAASTIYNRVHEDCLGLSENELIKPNHILNGKWEERTVDGKVKQFLNNTRCSLSKGKRTYIQSLAEHFNDTSKLKGVDLEQLSDVELGKRLIAVKGIAQWSVDMFMMFKLKRPDILSNKDLAIRKGVAKFYGKNIESFRKDNKYNRSRVNELTAHWAPYRSLASLYMYHTMNIDDDAS